MVPRRRPPPCFRFFAWIRWHLRTSALVEDALFEELWPRFAVARRVFLVTVCILMLRPAISAASLLTTGVLEETGPILAGAATISVAIAFYPVAALSIRDSARCELPKASRPSWRFRTLVMWALVALVFPTRVLSCLLDVAVVEHVPECAQLADGYLTVNTSAVPIGFAALAGGMLCLPSHLTLVGGFVHLLCYFVFSVLGGARLNLIGLYQLALASTGISALYFVNRTVEDVYIAIIDANKRRKLEEDARILEREGRVAAEAARAAHEQTMGYILHEVRNPTHAALGSLWMIQDKWSDGMPPGASDELLHLRRALDQVTGVVNDALDLQKLRSGNFTIRASSFSVQRLLRDVCNQVGRMSPVPFRLRVDAAVAETFRSDPARLRQVVMNGLTNAAKLSSSAPIVVLAYALAPEEAKTFLRRAVRARESAREESARRARLAAHPPAGTGSDAEGSAPVDGDERNDAGEWGWEPGRYLCVQVIDGGPGLGASADADILFQDFADDGGLAYSEAKRRRAAIVRRVIRRAGSTTVSRATDPRFSLLYSTSTGLGLPVARKIIRAMGGDAVLHDRGALPPEHPLHCETPPPDDGAPRLPAAADPVDALRPHCPSPPRDLRAVTARESRSAASGAVYTVVLPLQPARPSASSDSASALSVFSTSTDGCGGGGGGDGEEPGGGGPGAAASGVGGVGDVGRRRASSLGDKPPGGVDRGTPAPLTVHALAQPAAGVPCVDTGGRPRLPPLPPFPAPAAGTVPALPALPVLPVLPAVSPSGGPPRQRSLRRAGGVAVGGSGASAPSAIPALPRLPGIPEGPDAGAAGPGAGAPSLPPSLRPGAGTASTAPPPAPLAGTFSRVLVVDDESLNRRLLVQMVHRACGGGIVVDSASDGDEGLAMVGAAAEEGRPYDLLLLDVVMQNMNGDEMLLRVLATGLRPPPCAVVCTGNTMRSDLNRYHQIGFLASLTKPFNLKDLVTALTTAVEAHRDAHGPQP